MFRKMRPWAKLLAGLYLMVLLVVLLATATAASLEFVGGALDGQVKEVIHLAILVLSIVACLAVIFWAVRDARQVGRALRERRRELALPVGQPRPDGDMTEVVGLQQQLSWLGF